MTYCRYCGREITYKRTKNDKWMPCDVAGNPHFCNESKNKNTKQESGLIVCKKCGKPCFKDRKGKQREIDEEKLEEIIDIANKDYKTFEEWFSANTDKVEKMKDVAVGEYSLEYGTDEDLFTRELRQFLFLAYEA